MADRLTNAATDMGIFPRERRFFRSGGSPFQSLQNRFEIEASRMRDLQEEMALENQLMQRQENMLRLEGLRRRNEAEVACVPRQSLAGFECRHRRRAVRG